MSVFALALDASVRATPLLAIILLACALRPRSAPVLRHLALSIGLLAFLVVPVLGVLLPDWTLPVSDAVLGPAGIGGTPALPSIDAGPSTWSISASPVAVAVAVWYLGAMILLGRVCLGLLGVARLRRSARTVETLEGGGWQGRVGAVRVAVTRAVDTPMAVGLIRPTVLLPAADGWTGEDRKAVVAHELAHVRRGDAWTLLLAAVVRALHWPNPLVWLAARRLRAAGEEACDGAVLAAGVSPVEYAQLLVRLARSGAPARASRLVPGVAGSAGLPARVEALLRGGHPSPRRGRQPLLAGVLAVVIACVAAVRPAAPSTVAAADLYAARFGITEELAGTILRAAAAERVDPTLAFGLVSVESGFDPERTSRRGAIGLTQVLPTTAAELEPGIAPATLRDPDTNLRLGFRLLQRYLRRFAGDPERALLAYKIGPANAARAGAASQFAYPVRVLRAAAGSPGAAR